MSNIGIEVLHVTSWLSRRGGGIPAVVWSLARENRLLGIDCCVAGLDDEFIQTDCRDHCLKFVTGAAVGPQALGFSPSLRVRLREKSPVRGVVHSHGLWMYPGVLARSAANSASAPLVVSPHGMLEPWALRNSRWRKRLACWLFENRNLRSADCLHALCDAEARNIRAYGLLNPIAVIPNGVDLAEFSLLPPSDGIEADFPALKGKQRVLFLSRVHPKKGLEHLLLAWRNLQSGFPEWQLIVAGGGEPAYENKLHSLTDELGISNSVLFTGPLYGKAKLRALAGAEVFVLPSFSEGFSVAILEAAAAGIPVLLTPQCNFPELTAAGGAVEAEPDQVQCEIALRRLMSLSSSERKKMGSLGRQLMQREYTWSGVATRMLEVYRWILGKGERPDCVLST